jgi:hypothetical protein
MSQGSRIRRRFEEPILFLDNEECVFLRGVSANAQVQRRGVE